MHLKQLCSVILVSFISFSTFAQNSKGDIDFSVLASPLTTSGADDLGLIATFGSEFFLWDRASISANFITTNNTLFNSDSGNTIRSYSIMPSVQYYFLNNPKFHLYGQASYGLGFEDLTRENIDNSALRVFSAGVGMNIKMFDKLFLKILVPYFDAKNITIDANAANGLGTFVGFNYKL